MHLEATGEQPAAYDVERDRRPDVADVGCGLHSRAADVERHEARRQRLEVTNRPRPGVIKPQRHAARLRKSAEPNVWGVKHAK
jgi:hypothetical protein